MDNQALDQYEKELASFDWYYEYSDDHSVWQRGRQALAALQAKQKTLDADKAIWNKYAPGGKK